MGENKYWGCAMSANTFCDCRVVYGHLIRGPGCGVSCSTY